MAADEEALEKTVLGWFYKTGVCSICTI